MDPQLVSTEWLAAQDKRRDLVILDCSWHLPKSGRDARAEYVAEHIPGALFLDLNAVSDRESPYVNMLPPAAQFAAEVGKLGVSNELLVVLYDNGYVSARLWWMFKFFGHDNVRFSMAAGGNGKAKRGRSNRVSLPHRCRPCSRSRSDLPQLLIGEPFWRRHRAGRPQFWTREPPSASPGRCRPATRVFRVDTFRGQSICHGISSWMQRRATFTSRPRKRESFSRRLVLSPTNP